MKRGRRRFREIALQILFQFDHNPSLSVEQAVSQFQANFEGEMDDFSVRLVQGVRENIKTIDQYISEASRHWKTYRMEPVDRNVLRLGVFELCYCTDIPSTVTINEMVEIAKQFGSESSSAFVNGILDHIASAHPLAGKVQ